jgi:serine/threonine protein kinase
VKLYDIFEGEKSFYLILEFLEGETLYKIQKK